MALSLAPTAVNPKRKKVAMTNLQAEQQQVANPQALQQKPAVVAQKPAATAVKAPAAPSPPREAAPGTTMTTMSNAPRQPPPELPETGGAPVLPSAEQRQPTPNVPTQSKMPAPPRAASTGAAMQGTAGLDAIQDATGYVGAPSANLNFIADTRSGLQKAVDAKNAAEAASPQNAFDTQVQQLLSDLLAGKGMKTDTTEEEALIRELMQDRLGAGLVEQRARMGRAGFGASGALAAMEGDIRRQAGQQATQETLAIRRQAEQEAIQNALNAITAETEKRKAGRQEFFDQQFLDALQSQMDQNAPEQQPGGEIMDTISEQGIIGGAPTAAAQLFATAVRMMYGENANPADYYPGGPMGMPVKIPGR